MLLTSKVEVDEERYTQTNIHTMLVTSKVEVEEERYTQTNIHTMLLTSKVEVDRREVHTNKYPYHVTNK